MVNALSQKQIRDGWQVVRFGEIAKEVKKTAKTPIEDGLEYYIGLEHLDPQSLRIQRKGIIAEDTPSFTRRFNAGQILFGKRRCYQKKAAVPDFDGICSGDIIVMEAIPGKIIPGLLPFIVQSDMFFDWAIKTSSGSLSPRTKWKSLAEFEFPLPPMERQKEILFLLEKKEFIFQKYDEIQKKILSNIKALQFNAFPNYFEKHNQNYVPIKKGWEISEIQELLLSQPKSGFSAREIAGTSNWHVLNLNCLSKAGFVNNDYKPISENNFKKGRELKNGDFLISRSNTREMVGLVGIYKENENRAIFPDTMMCLNVNRNIIKPEFLQMYLLSPYGRRQIVRLSAGTSGSMVKINKKNINKIPVPYPSVKEQDKIVSAYLSMCEMNQNCAKQKKHISRIKQKYLWRELYH